MFRPVLITAPAAPPVSLQQAKAHLRVEHTSDDELIAALIDAATAHYDGWSGVLGRCLITQSWRQDFDGFARCLRLPLFPLASITSVTYDDAADAEQTVAAANYVLLDDGRGGYVRFVDDFAFPAVHAQEPNVRVTYVAGEATAPLAIGQAMLLLIGAWYENRENAVIGTITSPLPQAVAADALIAPYRRERI